MVERQCAGEEKRSPPVGKPISASQPLLIRVRASALRPLRTLCMAIRLPKTGRLIRTGKLYN